MYTPLSTKIEIENLTVECYKEKRHNITESNVYLYNVLPAWALLMKHKSIFILKACLKVFILYIGEMFLMASIHHLP